ncbi:MAG: M56 family metallopeptidase [Verrucomicrobiales bacterium]|nr:M56 family metallopeptidase [Verrucomicrobiales bacterium]
MTGDTFQAVVSGWALAMARVSTWGAVVILVAGVAERLIGGRSPRARSWLWRLAWVQLALLMLPASGRLVLPGSLRPPHGWDVELRNPAEPRSAASESAAPTLEGSAVPLATAAERNGAARRSDVATRRSFGREGWSAALFALWTAGATAGVVLLGRRRIGALRWIESARMSTDSWFATCAECWRSDLGRRCRSVGSRWLAGRLRIRVHPAVGSPRVAGLWRPTLLLPAAGPIPENEEAARAVFDHEWGHVVRGDLVWRWLRGWVRAVLFFHPLVAWADRRTTLAEEMACDRLALDAGGLSPGGYGRILVEWAEAERHAASNGRMDLAAAMSRQAAGLLERIHGLDPDRPGLSRRRLALVCFGVVTVGLLAWISIGGRRDIRQLDPRFPVLGFHVSRGSGHSYASSRETLEVFGMRLSRVQVTTREGATTFPEGLPSRVAGLLSRLGIQPDLRTSVASAGFSDGREGYAFFVRFRSGAKPAVHAPDGLRAELVDDAGHRVPLLEAELFRPASTDGEDVVRAWTLAPAPRTSGRFDLRLVLEDEDKEVALLRLGRIGGTP